MSLENEDFELTEETAFIQGFWLDLGSKVVKDSGWVRIEWLIENRLEQIVAKDGSSDTLYRNPIDGHLWHYHLVVPDIHEGGPPALLRIEEAEAQEIFGPLPI